LGGKIRKQKEVETRRHMKGNSKAGVWLRNGGKERKKIRPWKWWPSVALKKVPYLLECNAHLFWPNYVTKFRVRIRFDCKLESGNESDMDVDEFSNHESSAEDQVLDCHLVLYFNWNTEEQYIHLKFYGIKENIYLIKIYY
jgi:hypothetical protein